MPDYFSDYTNFNGDTLSDLADGWDEFKRPPSDALTGKEFTLFLDDGTQLDYAFLGRDSLRVAADGHAAAVESYEAHEEAPGAFIVGHQVSTADQPSYRYLILDFEGNRAIVFLATITDQTGPRGDTSIAIAQAGIDTESYEPVPEADDLLGQRTVWAYSHKHLFEHIYLNRNTFIWSCIRGAEVNQAYAEKAVYFRIRPGVYVLYWKQAKWALENIGLMNFNEWHLTLAGYAWDAAKKTEYWGMDNGYGQLLNVTSYDHDAVIENGRRAFEAFGAS